MRWVLGEQSARQLRGGNMQDVIFAGTETRKPQSFAAVSITFDNSDHALDIDFEEVTVTRRLYRSGESEYKINNSTVRLRDIHELFYDTGIGKEGYSRDRSNGSFQASPTSAGNSSMKLPVSSSSSAGRTLP